MTGLTAKGRLELSEGVHSFESVVVSIDRPVFARDPLLLPFTTVDLPIATRVIPIDARVLSRAPVMNSGSDEVLSSEALVLPDHEEVRV